MALLNLINHKKSFERKAKVDTLATRIENAQWDRLGVFFVHKHTLNYIFQKTRNIDCRGPGFRGKLWRTPMKTTSCALLSELFGRFQVGSKTALKAWCLPTVAYVGAKNLFKQTRRVSGSKTLQQKPLQFHQNADPILESKKRAPFGGPFSEHCA